MNFETEYAISRFVLRTANLVDQDKLEEWLDCFAETSRYAVMPRDNVEAGYQVGLIRCDNKNILKDRIAVLRHASKFNPHWDRHVLSGSTVIESTPSEAKVHTSFMVVQTTLNGVSTLYCCGEYRDRIALDGPLRLAERIVVVDTFSIDNCMAVPL